MHLALAALLLCPSQSAEDLHAAAAFRGALLAQRLRAVAARLPCCPPDCGCGCVGGHGCTCPTEVVRLPPVVVLPAARLTAAPPVPLLPRLPGPRYAPAAPAPAPARLAPPAAPVMPRAGYAPATAPGNC